jgi:hypothetical protein
MCGRFFMLVGLLAVASAAGCSSSGAPTLSPPAGAIETGATLHPSSTTVAVETTIMTPGTPTEVYTLVAHGALRCWFAPDGLLKATHVFNAEADSPTQGGAAAIVLHERDATLNDHRGARAFRITFAPDPGGVRVAVVNLKMPDAIAQPMVRDAETWARGGEGCETRAAGRSPPQAVSGKPR